MHTESGFPLDLAATAYSYVERPNPALLALAEEHIFRTPIPQILDVGCGAGANARAFRNRAPACRIVGIEPNAHAAELAREACSEVFSGTLEQWLAESQPSQQFDAIILSDILEHTADPLAFLRLLAEQRVAKNAVWLISVPNYAVWYNRVKTLFGRFEYAWSGLYDRTHLRFFTRRSLKDLLEYAGLHIIDDTSSPSLVQSAAPILRRFFEKEVGRGEHLALGDSRAYRVYQRFIEPLETRVCDAWPELLGFQIVCAARCR